MQRRAAQLVLDCLKENDVDCQDILEFLIDEALTARDDRQQELMNDDGAADIER